MILDLLNFLSFFLVSAILSPQHMSVEGTESMTVKRSNINKVEHLLQRRTDVRVSHLVELDG